MNDQFFGGAFEIVGTLSHVNRTIVFHLRVQEALSFV